MVLSAKNKVAAGYLCAFLILLVGVLAMNAFYSVQTARHAGVHARDVRTVVTQLETYLMEAKVGQRGYLLSHDVKFLEPLKFANAQIPVLLDKLAALHKDDAPRQQKLALFRTVMLARIRQLNQMVVDADAHPGAPITLSDDADREQMRELYSGLFAEEQELVNAREHTQSMLRDLSIIIGAGTALASVLVLLVTVWIGRALANEVDANKALRQSNVDLEQFAYVASHDLKAPLRGILNLSTWIEEDIANKATPQTKSLLEKLRGRVRRLEDLIAGIAAYSRAGKAGTATELVNVDSLIRGAAQLLNLPPNVELKIQSPFPAFYSNRVPLEQVFGNLIANAAKHGCKNGGTITIRCEDSARHVRFFVQDDGPGIPVEFHERIFELFQTLEPRDKVEGSGIGLAIVKKLVERYDGLIEVLSQPGAGTTFTFTWLKGAPA